MKKIKKLFNKKIIVYLCLSLIIILTTSLRLFNLENLPGAFFTDEAALGYNAWSLVTTLKDEYGKFLPLTLRSFDDYKPAIYSYLAIPFVSILGLTQTSSRMPAAISGILLVITIFFLIRKITKNNSLSLLSSLVLAITPWHIEISRTAIEAGVSLFLTTLSITIYKKDNKLKTILSLVLLVLSLWTYHSARLVAPLIILSAIFFRVIRVSRIYTFSVSLIFIFGIFLSLTASQSRFGQISIFSDLESQLIREEGIREDGGLIPTSIIETRINHNKLLSISQSFAKSYIKNTSLDYLFLGGAQPPRVTIPETGQFLLIFLPFFLFGLAISIRVIDKPINKWLIFWLIIAPIPASLTTAEIPNTYRTIFLLPVISILIALGLYTSYKLTKKYLGKISFFFAFLITIAISLNFYKAWHQYRVHQQVHQPWHRQYGYKDLIKYLNSIEDLAKVTITNRENEPYMMYLFYNKIEPSSYQSQPEKRLGHLEIDSGKDTWTLFNYTFTEEACPSNLDDNNINNYYVGVGTCEIPLGFESVNTINFLDNNPEFQIYRPIGFIEE
ncbi:MAG: hypothetical protein GW941_02705 [Candidatus Pacebacteria bacterium]|nr:hypothetical protein [Candidatus Paceibacterota bacterium]